MPKYPKLKIEKMKYDSPSGYVTTGKYIPPFEKVKDGFGFMGVIVEDYKTQKIQCHICGEWLEMFNSHLAQTHKMTSNEYRDKFGLLRSTALRSKRLRLIQSKNMIKLQKEHPEKFNNKYSNNGFSKNNSFAGNRKKKLKPLETKNKYGVCDLQIVDRIIKLQQELGKTPTLIDLKEKYGGGFIFHIHKRYHSYVTLCKTLEFDEIYSGHNPKYSREYFIEKALSNEPSTRIFTDNELRALYKYFKNGIKELKIIVQEIKQNA